MKSTPKNRNPEVRDHPQEPPKVLEIEPKASPSPSDILNKIVQMQREHDDETPLNVPDVKSYMIVYEAKKIGVGTVRNLVLAEEEDGRFRRINGKELAMLVEAYPWFKDWAKSPDPEHDA